MCHGYMASIQAFASIKDKFQSSYQLYKQFGVGIEQHLQSKYDECRNIINTKMVENVHKVLTYSIYHQDINIGENVPDLIVKYFGHDDIKFMKFVDRKLLLRLFNINWDISGLGMVHNEGNRGLRVEHLKSQMSRREFVNSENDKMYSRYVSPNTYSLKYDDITNCKYWITNKNPKLKEIKQLLEILKDELSGIVIKMQTFSWFRQQFYKPGGAPQVFGQGKVMIFSLGDNSDGPLYVIRLWDDRIVCE